MSDRILLMRHGHVVQEGPPTEIFDRPATRFVAGFMNVENLVEGTIEVAERDLVTLEAGGQRLVGPWTGRGRPEKGLKACMAIRAERLKLGTEPPPGGTEPINRVACTPGATIYKGKYLDQMLESPLGPIKARVWDRAVALGQLDRFWWRASDCAITPIDAD